MSLAGPICNVGGVCADLFFFFLFFLSAIAPELRWEFPRKRTETLKKIIEFCFFVYNRSTRPLQFLRRHCTLRISVMMVSVTMSLRRLPDKISMTRQQLLSRGPLAPCFFWYIVRPLPRYNSVCYVLQAQYGPRASWWTLVRSLLFGKITAHGRTISTLTIRIDGIQEDFPSGAHKDSRVRYKFP